MGTGKLTAFVIPLTACLLAVYATVPGSENIELILAQLTIAPCCGGRPSSTSIEDWVVICFSSYFVLIRTPVELTAMHFWKSSEESSAMGLMGPIMPAKLLGWLVRDSLGRGENWSSGKNDI